MKLLLAAFLAAHALIHVSYLTPAPPRTADGPEWPFAMERSWLIAAGLDPAVVRAIGTGLAVATIALLVGAALSTLGWIVPAAWWSSLTVGGAVASVLMLAAFFHPWLSVGLAIDAALVWAALVAGWTPAQLTP